MIKAPTWQGSHAQAWLDRLGGIRIRHEDGTEIYLQPGDDTSDLICTLNACADDRENIDVLLCDRLEGL